MDSPLKQRKGGRMSNSMSEKEKLYTSRLFAAAHYLMRSIYDYDREETKEFLDEIEGCAKLLRKSLFGQEKDFDES